MKDKIRGLLVSAINDLYESKDLSIEIVKTKSLIETSSFMHRFLGNDSIVIH